jgi:hypothetical protein
MDTSSKKKKKKERKTFALEVKLFAREAHWPQSRKLAVMLCEFIRHMNPLPHGEMSVKRWRLLLTFPEGTVSQEPEWWAADMQFMLVQTRYKTSQAWHSTHATALLIKMMAVLQSCERVLCTISNWVGKVAVIMPQL